MEKANNGPVEGGVEGISEQRLFERSVAKEGAQVAEEMGATFSVMPGDGGAGVNPLPFAENIEKAIAGKLPPNAVLELGRPGDILKGAGLPDLPIRMRQRTVRRKSGKHSELTKDVLQALPSAIQSPMAVYVSPGDAKSHAVVTSIPTPTGPVTGYFSVRLDSAGENVLDTKTVFGKPPSEIIAEIKRAKVAGEVYTNETAFNEWLASQARGVDSDTSHQHQATIEGLKELFSETDGSQEPSFSLLPDASNLDAEFGRMFSPFHRSPELRMRLRRLRSRRQNPVQS